MNYINQNFSAQLERLDCRHGKMHAFASDNVIGKSLRLYGEWAEHELSILRTLIPEGSTVVDVGANLGYFSLLAAKLVGPTGRVVALEPNSENCRLLLSSLRLNGTTNVDLLPVAADVCRYTYGKMWSVRKLTSYSGCWIWATLWGFPGTFFAPRRTS